MINVIYLLLLLYDTPLWFKNQIAEVAVVHNVVYTTLTVVQKRNFVCLKLVIVGERSQKLYMIWDLFPGLLKVSFAVFKKHLNCSVFISLSVPHCRVFTWISNVLTFSRNVSIAHATFKRKRYYIHYMSRSPLYFLSVMRQGSSCMPA